MVCPFGDFHIFFAFVMPAANRYDNLLFLFNIFNLAYILQVVNAPYHGAKQKKSGEITKPLIAAIPF
jgi:hypothetical protein